MAVTPEVVNLGHDRIPLLEKRLTELGLEQS